MTSHAAPLVDEIANELATWPGVRIERRSQAEAVALYDDVELGLLDRDRGVAELHFWHPEHEALIEHGDAEPATAAPESDVVRHDIEGPSDVTAVLGLFDRRYRDVTGEGAPYSSKDPD